MDGSSTTIAAATPLAWLRQRAFASVFSVVMVGATLAPIAQNWREEPQDSFPLSYYPMFSQDRRGTYKANYIVGVDARGDRHTLSYAVAGKGGFNQVRRQIGRYLDEGRGDKLAREIAGRVARKRKPPLGDIVTIQVVRGEFDFDRYFHGDKRPLSETIKGSAPVRRGAR